MKQLNEIFQEIDWVRNTVWFLLYALTLFFLFIGWVMPELDEFRRANIEYRKANFLHKEAHKELQGRESEIRLFEDENAPLLLALKESITKEAIAKIFVDFFEDLTLHELSRERNALDFEVVRFSLEGKSANSALFQRFIQEIGRMGHIVKIGFPISLKKEEEKLLVKMKVEVYRTVFDSKDSDTMPSLKQ